MSLLDMVTSNLTLIAFLLACLTVFIRLSFALWRDTRKYKKAIRISWLIIGIVLGGISCLITIIEKSLWPGVVGVFLWTTIAVIVERRRAKGAKSESDGTNRSDR